MGVKYIPETVAQAEEWQNDGAARVHLLTLSEL